MNKHEAHQLRRIAEIPETQWVIGGRYSIDKLVEYSRWRENQPRVRRTLLGNRVNFDAETHVVYLEFYISSDWSYMGIVR